MSKITLVPSQKTEHVRSQLPGSIDVDLLHHYSVERVGMRVVHSPRRSGSSAKSARLTIVAAAILAASGAPAAAHHTVSGNYLDNMFVTPNTASVCYSGKYHLCQTDNATLTVHKQNSLTQFGKTNINWTLDNSWDTTSLNVTYHPDPVYSGSAETDIIYRVNGDDVPDGYAGIVWCDNVSGSSI